VAYQFVTRCGNCAKQFGILWVMDSTRQVDPKTVARITCPLCGKRFHQDAKDLREFGSQTQKLVFGHPVRSVEVDYDCPSCGKEHVQIAVCNNGRCSQRGLLQTLKPSRVVLGSLNPVETSN
jgi:DNA-directed RNA polymerase subunit RPC12/RpoP